MHHFYFICENLKPLVSAHSEVLSTVCWSSLLVYLRNMQLTYTQRATWIYPCQSPVQKNLFLLQKENLETTLERQFGLLIDIGWKMIWERLFFSSTNGEFVLFNSLLRALCPTYKISTIYWLNQSPKGNCFVY